MHKMSHFSSSDKIRICIFEAINQSPYFGWKAFFPGENGKFQGAVSYGPECVPINNGVFISFEVQDMDVTIQRVKNNGGKIIHPKQKIEEEGFGYSSLIIDSEGNRIGLSSDQ